MDYTQSSGFAIDAGTTNRMHLQAQAVPTDVSDNDINQMIWEAMEIVKAAGLVGAPFDKAVPATYQKLLTALRAAGVFSTAAGLDNTTKAATTAFVRAELLSLGNAAYAAIFGSLKSSSGYQRLPGGFILQWQSGISAYPSDATVSFPIAFPTALLYVSAVGDYTPGSGVTAYFNVAGISATQCTVRGSAALGCRILSIGY